LKAVLRSWRDEAQGVRHFEFEVPAVDSFVFTPGQFVSVHFDIGGETITRAYSIASAPNANRFALCLNLVDGGLVSPQLFALAGGDAIEVSEPLGYFVLRPQPTDSLLIATGTGVAPMRAMLPGALEQNPGKHFTLLFGTRTPDSILYADEFTALEHEHPNFHFWPTLSRADASWTGRRGHVQQHLDEALATRRDMDVYICGLRVMVDDVRARLKALGFDRKQIISERYD
jgi:ferredoxin-NADP reductase